LFVANGNKPAGRWDQRACHLPVMEPVAKPQSAKGKIGR
jgi:hypothetical protein